MQPGTHSGMSNTPVAAQLKTHPGENAATIARSRMNGVYGMWSARPDGPSRPNASPFWCLSLLDASHQVVDSLPEVQAAKVHP